MSDLLVNIQDLAQDQLPGHSPPAACPMDGLGGLGSPTPSKPAELSALSFCFPNQRCASPGVEAPGAGCRWLWARLGISEFLPPTQHRIQLEGRGLGF